MSFKHEHVPGQAEGAVSYQSRPLIPAEIFLETGSATKRALQDTQQQRSDRPKHSAQTSEQDYNTMGIRSTSSTALLQRVPSLDWI